MTKHEPAGDTAARNLQEAIDRLQDDIASVQIWANALGCFSRPIPDYQPSNDFVLPQVRTGLADDALSNSERVYR